jgi:hypothetical protein
MQLMDDAGFGRFTLAFRLRCLRRLDTLVGDRSIGRGRLRRGVNWRRLNDIFRRLDSVWHFNSFGRFDSLGLLDSRLLIV